MSLVIDLVKSKKTTFTYSTYLGLPESLAAGGKKWDI